MVAIITTPTRNLKGNVTYADEIDYMSTQMTTTGDILAENVVSLGWLSKWVMHRRWMSLQPQLV